MQLLSLQSYKSYKILYGIIAAAAIMLLAVFLLKPNTADAAVGGPTCRVPADYATIQAAVDDTGCDTVKVSAGTYNENVVINRSVKLRGARAGVDADGRTFGAGNESKIVGSATTAVTVNAPNVIVDGFSITNPGQTLGLTVKTAGNNAKIQNNIVNGVGSNVYNQPTVGIYLENGPDQVKVNSNKIENILSDKSAQGVLIGDSLSNDPSVGNVVDGNTIKDITSTSKSGYGVQVNNGGKSNAGYAEVKIRANEISNIAGGWVHAIGLEGKTPNGIVRYNKISNLVTNNPIDKVGVFFEDNPFFFTVEVNRNSLDVGGDRFGVAVAPPLTSAYPSLSVDAECNWWGDKSGPGQIASGSGSLVGPGVDYSPWLKSANLNGKCSDKQDRDEDNDWHHGDKDCRYDDLRNENYRD